MSGDHDHGGGHANGGAGADARAPRIALGLIVGFMMLEVIVAVLAGSLALLADAGHMLTDAAALATALWAIRLAARPRPRPPGASVSSAPRSSRPRSTASAWSPRPRSSPSRPSVG